MKATKALNRQLQRGQHHSVIICQGVQCLAWKDKKAIPIINTICKPSSTTTVNQKMKDGTRITVACPEAVQKYNTYMGGVDIADQMRKSYSCKRRSQKWWLPLFYFLVDISVVNSHIICHETPHSAKRTLKEFILELADELMASHCSRKRSAQPSLDAPSSARFCERHFPKRSDERGQCRVCSKDSICRRVMHCCMDYDPQGSVFLCVDPCFRLFHTRN